MELLEVNVLADLDGGSGEAAQLFDVLPLLPDDGSHRLCWDVDVDRLLLRSLRTCGEYLSVTPVSSYR